jgi:hypothetical protein
MCNLPIQIVPDYDSTMTIRYRLIRRLRGLERALAIFREIE